MAIKEELKENKEKNGKLNLVYKNNAPNSETTGHLSLVLMFKVFLIIKMSRWIWKKELDKPSSQYLEESNTKSQKSAKTYKACKLIKREKLPRTSFSYVWH